MLWFATQTCELSSDIFDTNDYSTGHNDNDTDDMRAYENTSYTKDTTTVKHGGANGADVYD